MKKVLAVALPPFVVIAVIWLAVILWWRVTLKLPDGRDVLLWLVAFPLCVLLGYWLLKKSFDGLKWVAARLAAAASASAAAPSAAASDGAQSDVRPAASLKLLGGAVLLPQADNPQTLLETLEEPVFTPAPDDTLTDEQGSALLVTAVPGLNVDSLREQLTAALPGHDVQPRVLRTLALTSSLIEQVLPQLQLDGVMQAGTRLHVVLLLPTAWPESSRDLTANWLRQQFQLGREAAVLSAELGLCHDNTDVLRLIEQQQQQSERLDQQQMRRVMLAIAADSLLDADAIRVLGGRIYGRSNSRGVVPGEGAAAVWWMVEPTQPATSSTSTLVTTSAPEGCALLYRARFGTRSDSAEARPEPDAATLLTLAREAVQAAALPPAGITHIVSDVDHRGRRLMEVIGLGNAFDKEAPLRSASVGASMGLAGAVSTLAALVAAHHLSVKQAGPVMMVAAAGERERAVVLVTPTDMPTARVV